MTTTRFDASVEIRPSAGREVVNHERVRIHLGTAEVIGKIILLGGLEVLPPKSTALCQVVTQEPLVALRGDHFVLRNQTAQGTLGGGVVVNPFAQRHRKAETQVTERLHALQTPTCVRPATPIWKSARSLAVRLGRNLSRGKRAGRGNYGPAGRRCGDAALS